MPPVDPAILSLLSLSPDTTTSTSQGGSGFSSISKITTTLLDGTPKTYFVKIGSGSAAEIMFKGEHVSLNAIRAVDPTLCPRSFGYGRLANSPSKYFLVTDFLHLSRSTGAGCRVSLAAKMAKLHTTPAPVPTGWSKPVFGFPETTCCGETPQPNNFNESWAQFYADNRLRAILMRSEARDGTDHELKDLVMQICDKVVPRLLGDAHLNEGKGVVPVVCHGDLWSGNASRGCIGRENGQTEELVFDPSAVYGHSEYDLGIMKMFGGFSGFFEEYHKLCPKTEPVDEYEDRVKLYELYHHLNHYAMFGGGYKGGAVRIMHSLLLKYGRVSAR